MDKQQLSSITRRNKMHLGHVQIHVLTGLCQHQSWYPGCGWIWGSTSRTLRVLDSLVRAGMAVKKGADENAVFRLTPDGTEFLTATRPWLYRKGG